MGAAFCNLAEIENNPCLFAGDLSAAAEASQALKESIDCGMLVDLGKTQANLDGQPEPPPTCFARGEFSEGTRRDYMFCQSSGCQCLPSLHHRAGRRAHPSLSDMHPEPALLPTKGSSISHTSMLALRLQIDKPRGGDGGLLSPLLEASKQEFEEALLHGAIYTAFALLQ